MPPASSSAPTSAPWALRCCSRTSTAPLPSPACPTPGRGPAGGAGGAPALLGPRHGPVAVYGLPYLEPETVRERWRLTTASHEAALTEAVSRVRADLSARPTGTPPAAAAHAAVA